MNALFSAPTLFVYGPPATGKSTCARNLAVALGKEALDLDTLVERRLRMSIPKYVAEAGGEAFRDVESAVLKELCAKKPDAVVALGGGTLLRPENRACAEACAPIVCLHTPVEVLARRVERKAGSRPFSKDADALRKTLEERKAHYDSFPLSVVLSGDLPPQEVWPKVLATAGRYIVSGMGKPYPVVILPDAWEELPRVLKQLSPTPAHLLLVGDSNTLPLYRERVSALLGGEVPCVEISAGEEHKTLQTVEQLWQAMCKAGLERNDVVLALGGGVTGDLTGFAAATWLRGIRWINLPTSLLAMVDAGIGGKTGADLSAGKNLIGAFHPPCAVLAETNALRTLPEREVRCGLAETYKHAVIGDTALLEALRQFASRRADSDFLVQLVIRSAGVKVRTIQEDPFEQTGRRAALNLGHTVGHAVEAASGFRVTHGEAVAIGTVVAAHLAERLGFAQHGLAERIETDLQALGLPTKIPAGETPEQLRGFLARDKKNAGGEVRFVLPITFGEVKTGCHVPEEVLNEVLAGKWA